MPALPALLQSTTSSKGKSKSAIASTAAVASTSKSTRQSTSSIIDIAPSAEIKDVSSTTQTPARPRKDSGIGEESLEVSWKGSDFVPIAKEGVTLVTPEANYIMFFCPGDSTGDLHFVLQTEYDGDSTSWSKLKDSDLQMYRDMFKYHGSLDLTTKYKFAVKI